MNEERTGKCLRQVENIRGNFGHRYSITVNQVMVTTIYQGNPDRNHKFCCYVIKIIHILTQLSFKATRYIQEINKHIDSVLI
jgi:hypothetical protein